MLDNILKEISSRGTIYDEIINNIIQPNFHLKPELISEIALSFLENREKIEMVIEQNYFLYYFIRTVKNQYIPKQVVFIRIHELKNTYP